MKKIAVAILTVCVLLSLSPQLIAQVCEIEIKVAVDKEGNFYIDMGEKYAYAVPEESTIRWTCVYPFTLKFEEDVFFLNTTVKDTDISKQKKVKKDALKNHAYKYSVTILKKNSIPEIILDPVIIIKPPKT
jgi:hypothetical protein